MAKKRKNTSKNKLQALLSKLLLGLCVLLVLGLMPEGFVDNKFQHKEILNKVTSFVTEIKNKPLIKVEVPTAHVQKDATGQQTYIDIESLMHPVLLDEQECEKIQHIGFSLSHNQRYKMANYVSYELTREELDGKHTRNNRFTTDPGIKGYGATASDYAKSGYDRGHLAPAADMTWSKEAMQQSFYYSNMSPQTPDFNRGVWKRLEAQTREWAQRDSAILVITGPIVPEDAKTIGDGVAIPSHFYKIIVNPHVQPMRAIGFLLKHEGSLRNLSYFATPIDSIEALAKINFLEALPDDIEDALEGTPDLQYWF